MFNAPTYDLFSQNSSACAVRTLDPGDDMSVVCHPLAIDISTEAHRQLRNASLDHWMQARRRMFPFA